MSTPNTIKTLSKAAKTTNYSVGDLVWDSYGPLLYQAKVWKASCTLVIYLKRQPTLDECKFFAVKYGVWFYNLYSPYDDRQYPCAYGHWVYENFFPKNYGSHFSSFDVGSQFDGTPPTSTWLTREEWDIYVQKNRDLDFNTDFSFLLEYPDLVEKLSCGFSFVHTDGYPAEEYAKDYSQTPDKLLNDPFTKGVKDLKEFYLAHKDHPRMISPYSAKDFPPKGFSLRHQREWYIRELNAELFPDGRPTGKQRTFFCFKRRFILKP